MAETMTQFVPSSSSLVRSRTRSLFYFSTIQRIQSKRSDSGHVSYVASLASRKLLSPVTNQVHHFYSGHIILSVHPYGKCNRGCWGRSYGHIYHILNHNAIDESPPSDFLFCLISKLSSLRLGRYSFYYSRVKVIKKIGALC